MLQGLTLVRLWKETIYVSPSLLCWAPFIERWRWFVPKRTESFPFSGNTHLTGHLVMMEKECFSWKVETARSVGLFCVFELSLERG